MHAVRCKLDGGNVSAHVSVLLLVVVAGKPADWLYCRELLVHTGIVVVPGSGFGQVRHAGKQSDHNKNVTHIKEAQGQQPATAEPLWC
jgi:aspartate/methionine/tyrosine aminotransferase